ncbi:MAG: ABC transporter permease [Geminicoccaceae bacterium]|nr:ABC transporter permease [Geminicoccaceae bacterium]
MSRPASGEEAGTGALVAAVVALFLPLGSAGWWFAQPAALLLVLGFVAVLAATRGEGTGLGRGLVLATAVLLASAAPLLAIDPADPPGLQGPGIWLLLVALFLAAFRAMGLLSAATARQGPAALLVPALFGVGVLYVWELLVRGFGIPGVLLPPPSAIGRALVAHADVLRADFVQTFVRAVIPGWAIGCAAGFAVALLADRIPFLARGLLPLGNLVAALPIVGIAPILVMWFGFDWHSKAAVVVVMTFFPMLVNTLEGLRAAGRLERDLMRSYAASYLLTLWKLRLPTAAPFVFNALKINSTLALIGAIVAEFFGTPIVGMGFRISTEVAKMALDLVWATIAVAAVAGSAAYGLLALLERRLTFWHPSFRRVAG